MAARLSSHFHFKVVVFRSYLRPMQNMQWVAIFLCLLLTASCFFTWATIDQKNIVISGVSATGTAFGKPGYMHILLAAIAAILLLVNKPATNRITIFVTGFNAAWAVRNFVLIPTCYGGICPMKHTALYLVLFSSLALLITNLFIKIPTKQ